MLGGAQSQKEVERGRKGGSSVLGWNGQPSRTIDCYEFLEQVGEGTYGQVFKGRDKMTKEIVALKKIRFYSKGQGLPLTALREIKILKQLKHENMVCLKEIVTSVGSREWKNGASSSNVSGTVTEEDRRGSIYLVLEYVEHDLAGLLDHSYIFSVPAVKFVVKQLLKVLSHMHEHAYLHRDIKCSNLLIDNSYNLKVADFGLARRLALRSSGEGSSACDALTNKVITLWYRPPELLLGSRQYGPAVDLWGVGCIMAELLTGRPIFPGRNEMEQANMIFKVCGTPNDKSWPNHKNLAYCKKMIPSSSTYVDVLDTHLRTMAKKRPMQMDEHWDDFMTRETIQLIKRLLTLDPRRRCTAAAALSAGWFVTKPACPERASDLSPLNTNGASFHEWKTKKERKKVAELKQQQREAAISTSSVHSPDAVAGSELQQQQHIAPPLPPPSNPTPVNKPPPPCTTTQYHVQINSNNRYPQGNHESAVTALSCSVVNQAQATCAVSPPHPPLLSTSILPTTNNRKDEIAIEGDIEKKIILKKRREGLAKWYKQKQLKSSSSSSLDCEENGHHGCNRKLTSSTNDDVKNEGGTQMAGALESTPDSLHLSKRSEGVMSSSSHLRRGSSSDNYVESYAFVPSDNERYAKQQGHCIRGSSSPKRRRMMVPAVIDNIGTGGNEESVGESSSGVDRATAHNNRYREEQLGGGGGGGNFANTTRIDVHNNRPYDSSNDNNYVEREGVRDYKRLLHHGGRRERESYSERQQRWSQKGSRKFSGRNKSEYHREKWEHGDGSHDYAKQAMSPNHHSRRKRR